MNKKILAGVAVIALGIGGGSAIAIQSHAQQVTSQAEITIPVVTSPTTTDVATISDTDNIQNDQGGIDKPDDVIETQSDGETSDATSTIKHADKDQAGETTDLPEAGDTPDSHASN